MKERMQKVRSFDVFLDMNEILYFAGSSRGFDDTNPVYFIPMENLPPPQVGF